MRHLLPQHRSLHPYHTHPGFLGGVNYDNGNPTDNVDSWIVVEKDMLISHLPYFSRPEGTFDIPHPIHVVVNSLHRFRVDLLE